MRQCCTLRGTDGAGCVLCSSTAQPPGFMTARSVSSAPRTPRGLVFEERCVRAGLRCSGGSALSAAATCDLATPRSALTRASARLAAGCCGTRTSSRTLASRPST
eukprot:494247-Rhodomonas_salina.1